MFPLSPTTGIAWRIALFYGAIFIVLGVSLPYFPLWLEWRGLSPLEIGLVTSVPLFIRIIATPIIGLAADRAQSVRSVILIAGCVGLVSSALLMLSSGVWLILALFTIFQVASMAKMPLAEVIAMQAVRERGLDYGRMRLWGSVAFIAANVAGGLIIASYGKALIMPIIVAGSAASLTAAWYLPKQDRGRSASNSLTWKATLSLLSKRGLLLIMLAGGILQASHAVYYAFSAIHWQAQGIDGRWFGVLWGIGVVAEVVLFAYAGAALKRIGAIAMIGIGAIGALVRWLLMAFDPSFGALMCLQLLHGLTFGATHLGTVHAIQERVGPENAASAQSLHSALSSGILMGLATVLAGAIYTDLQGQSYLIMSLLAMVGGAIILFASRHGFRSPSE